MWMCFCGCVFIVNPSGSGALALCIACYVIILYRDRVVARALEVTANGIFPDDDLLVVVELNITINVAALNPHSVVGFLNLDAASDCGIADFHTGDIISNNISSSGRVADLEAV